MDAHGEFFIGLAGIGATAFALVFAAIQFRWEEWSRSRLGKISAVSALFELFTITVVSLAIAANLTFDTDPPLWPVPAIVCGGIGYYFTIHHLRVYRDTPRPERSRGDDKQYRLNVLPFISFGALALLALAALMSERREEWAQAGVAVVSIWFFASGCFESFFTLSPHWLEPEPAPERKSSE